MKDKWPARHVLDLGTQRKRCRETVATCDRCSNQGHNKEKCTRTKVRCCHCGVNHQAPSRNFLIFKREKEIVQFQTNEREPRLQAIQKLLRLNQNPEWILSNAVKNTSNSNTSKSPTRSEQEIQSDSSKDTNVMQFFCENFGIKEDNSPTVSSYGHGYYSKGKGKKKRRLHFQPLIVGGVRVKRVRKYKIRRCKIRAQLIFPYKSKTLSFQVQISHNRLSKELQKCR